VRLSLVETASAAILPADAYLAWSTLPRGNASLPEAILVLGFSLYAAIAIAWLGWQRRQAIVSPARQTGLYVGQFLMLCVSIALAVTVGASTSAFDGLNPNNWLLLLLTIVFILIGAFIGKVPPNIFVGLRTPWARRSRLAWDLSNRLAGKLILITGVAGLVVVLCGRAAASVVLLGTGGVLATVAGACRSFWVWRTDPDRMA
jgi:uncharacterized membrane protein